jgi:hypothetical protein
VVELVDEMLMDPMYFESTTVPTGQRGNRDDTPSPSTGVGLGRRFPMEPVSQYAQNIGADCLHPASRAAICNRGCQRCRCTGGV